MGFSSQCQSEQCGLSQYRSIGHSVQHGLCHNIGQWVSQYNEGSFVPVGQLVSWVVPALSGSVAMI